MSAKVSWPASKNPVDTYEITVKDKDGNVVRTIPDVPGTSTETTIGQLTPETEYTVTVRAVKDGVKGTESPASDPFTTLPTGKFITSNALDR